MANSAQRAGSDPLCCRKLRPHPTCVETTLPRIRQVGESASPRLDVGA
jgi:hypothetical protein